MGGFLECTLTMHGFVRKILKFRFLVIWKTWDVIVLPLKGIPSQDLRCDVPFKEVGVKHPKF